MTPQELEQAISGCTLCGLHKTRTNVVVGEGPLDAAIMIVGEAPGRQEDAAGRPFVGSAGKNLMKLVADCGLAREDVYICNIVKCRPIGPTGADRRPTSAECSNCSSYLKHQIELIRPRAIVAVGVTAAQRLLQTKASLKVIRESSCHLGDIPVIPTFHTSGLGLNREPGRKDAVRRDIVTAMSIAAA